MYVHACVCRYSESINIYAIENYHMVLSAVISSSNVYCNYAIRVNINFMYYYSCRYDCDMCYRRMYEDGLPVK